MVVEIGSGRYAFPRFVDRGNEKRGDFLALIDVPFLESSAGFAAANQVCRRSGIELVLRASMVNFLAASPEVVFGPVVLSYPVIERWQRNLARLGSCCLIGAGFS